MNEATQQWIRQNSLASGLPEDRITKKFNEVLEKQKTMHPGLDEAALLSMTRRQCFFYFNRMIVPGAVMFVGVPAFCSDITDRSNKSYIEALEAYQNAKEDERKEMIFDKEKNPNGIVRIGKVKDAGKVIPVDNRKYFKQKDGSFIMKDGSKLENKSFGKDIREHNYQQVVRGVCYPYGKQTDMAAYDKFKLTIYGNDKTDSVFNPTNFTTLEFSVFQKSKNPDDGYVLTTHKNTGFVPVPNNPVDAEGLIGKFFGDHALPVENLERYAIEHANDFNAFAFTQGYVMRADFTRQTPSGRYFVDITSDPENFHASGEHKTVSVLIKTKMDELVYGTKILVSGKPSYLKNEGQEGKLFFMASGVKVLEQSSIDQDDMVDPEEIEKQSLENAL